IDATTELNEDAVGVQASNVDFGYVLMTPTLAGLPGFAKILPKMHALKGTMPTAGLVGMEDVLQASLDNVLIEVNDGTKWAGLVGPARVNFKSSFDTDEQEDLFGSQNGVITVGELRTLSGVDSYQDLYLSSDLATDVLTLATVVDVLDTSTNGILSVAEAQDFLSDANDEAAETADADKDGRLEPAGYEIRTGTDTPSVYLDYDGNRREAASADRVLVQLADFV
ncbi:MAG: hypothetical protein GY722_20720, partial [bacterium]|nr:hypothetical protein [bacterium]